MKDRRGILSNILKNRDLTKFEKSVYTATLDIPHGQLRSYKWIAAKIGRPAAYRAVGNALNKNPYPRIVPCHRVVRSDGSIGGFSRGRSAKARLLEFEGIDASTTLRVDCFVKRCYNRGRREA